MQIFECDLHNCLSCSICGECHDCKRTVHSEGST